MQETVIEMVKNSEADLIFCGHTHIPCGYSLENNKTVVNVGSVGRPLTQDKRACYVQLTVDRNSKFFVEHRLISYDNYTASKEILARKLKHGEDLAKMVFDEK